MPFLHVLTEITIAKNLYTKSDNRGEKGSIMGFICSVQPHFLNEIFIDEKALLYRQEIEDNGLVGISI